MKQERAEDVVQEGTVASPNLLAADRNSLPTIFKAIPLSSWSQCAVRIPQRFYIPPTPLTPFSCTLPRKLELVEATCAL